MKPIFTKSKRGYFSALAISLTLLAFAVHSDGAPVESPEDVARSSPPDPLPVRVETSFYLLNLTFVNERTETFDADVYLDFQWRDPRLAFTPKTKNGKKIYYEKEAEEKIEEIWWPEIEFVNAATPQITNRTLEIHPDGTVEYHLGVSATFSTKLNLRRFPFDKQDLQIRLQSFLWDKNSVLFTASAKRCGHASEDTFDDLAVTGVSTSVGTKHVSYSDKDYSEFVVAIAAKRNSIFYIWRVFFPAVLIMVLSFSVYFMNMDDLYSRVNIGITCLLACIATQFAISYNLPRISYLTQLDKLYMITYGCIAISVGVSTVEVIFHRRNHPHSRRYNRFALWFVPLLYALLLAGVVLF
ncbi:MAG: hypothetical protein P8123_07905 [bacterium]